MLEPEADHKRSILVTGASGMCGRFIYASFLHDKDSYVVYTTSRRDVEHVRHISHDLNEPLSFDKFPQQVDLVVHSAALVDETTSAYSVVDSNVRSMFNVVNYALSARASCFIHFSSISVYGRAAADECIDESYLPRPVTSYGLSKVLSETLCSSILGDKLRWFNLRLGYVLSPEAPSRYLVRRFVEQLARGDSIELVNPDVTRFSFVDISDIALVCETLFARPVASGTFNVVGDECPTVRHLFQTVRGSFPASRSAVTESEKPDSIYAPRFCNERIKQALGIERFLPYEQSVLKILSTWRANG